MGEGLWREGLSEWIRRTTPPETTADVGEGLWAQATFRANPAARTRSDKLIESWNPLLSQLCVFVVNSPFPKIILANPGHFPKYVVYFSLRNRAPVALRSLTIRNEVDPGRSKSHGRESLAGASTKPARGAHSTTNHACRPGRISNQGDVAFILIIHFFSSLAARLGQVSTSRVNKSPGAQLNEGIRLKRRKQL